MIRIKRGVCVNHRHKKILKQTKGYVGRRKSCYRIARLVLEKGMQHTYRHRKEFKRDMRSLWIMRINAAVRLHGLNYSQFMYQMKQAGYNWNRKVLSELAIHHPEHFAQTIQTIA